LTYRARYYANLAWMLDEIASAYDIRFSAGEMLPFEEYNEIVARFERFLAFAEAVQHRNDRSGCAWVGMRRSRSLVRGGRSNLPLDVSLTVQEGTNGALANYRPSMLKIGLLSEAPGMLPDTLTDKGRKLADKFRRAVQMSKAGRASELCRKLDRRSVSVQELEGIGKQMCLSMVGDQECQLLNPDLLGDKHEALVAELRDMLRKRCAPTEGEILKSYLQSAAQSGKAFELKQIAIYQAFAVACLGLFKGLLSAFGEIGPERQLDDILSAQLKSENIQPSLTLNKLARGVEGWDEIESLCKQPNDWSSEPAEWIGPALRLLAWLADRLEKEPALALSEPVVSVSLPGVTSLMRPANRPVQQVVEKLCEQLVYDHRQVFLSKAKQPWLNLNGSCLRLEDDTDLLLGFPPNSVRLGSLISIFRDLEVRNV